MNEGEVWLFIIYILTFWTHGASADGVPPAARSSTFPSNCPFCQGVKLLLTPRLYLNERFLRVTLLNSSRGALNHKGMVINSYQMLLDSQVGL